MTSIQSRSRPNASAYSPHKMQKPINFSVFAPEAHGVTLIGDFNDWSTFATPMKKQVDGSWHAQVPLRHGAHHYQFMIDGQPFLDPRAHGVARNERGERVSLLLIS